MARLVSAIKIKGTLDDITFYGGPEGETYVKMKSSLNAAKFWSWPSFENSRRSARRLGMASKLTSLVYRCMEKGSRQRTNTYRRKMVGVVCLWLKGGMTGLEVVVKLAEAMAVPIEVLKTRELCLRQSVPDYTEQRLEQEYWEKTSAVRLQTSAVRRQTSVEEKTSASRPQTVKRVKTSDFGLQTAVGKRHSDYGLKLAVGRELSDVRLQTSFSRDHYKFGTQMLERKKASYIGCRISVARANRALLNAPAMERADVVLEPTDSG